MLYSHTPYLTDLQQQIGRKYAKIVANAVDRFKQFRNKIDATLKNDEASRAKKRTAKKFDEKLPNSLQQSSAELLGPEYLPRGTNTHVVIAAVGDDGSWYAIDFIVVHTDHDGNWSVLGREPLDGRLRKIPSNKIRSYERDDLGEFVGQAESFIGRINEAATGILHRFEDQPIGTAGGDIGDNGLLIGDDSESSLFGSTNSEKKRRKRRRNSSSNSSVKKKLYEAAQRNPKKRRTYGTTTQSMEDSVSGPERELTAPEVETRLKRHGTRPRWFRKMRKRANRQDWRDFLEDYVKGVYNEAKDQGASYERLWSSIKKHANDQNLLV